MEVLQVRYCSLAPRNGSFSEHEPKNVEESYMLGSCDSRGRSGVSGGGFGTALQDARCASGIAICSLLVS